MKIECEGEVTIYYESASGADRERQQRYTATLTLKGALPAHVEDCEMEMSQDLQVEIETLITDILANYWSE